MKHRRLRAAPDRESRVRDGGDRKSSPPPSAAGRVARVRFVGERAEAPADAVAVEEPLEIRRARRWPW
jgi:hypothetical protein